jgi:hypothetical protein
MDGSLPRSHGRYTCQPPSEASSGKQLGRLRKGPHEATHASPLPHRPPDLAAQLLSGRVLLVARSKTSGHSAPIPSVTSLPGKQQAVISLMPLTCGK